MQAKKMTVAEFKKLRGAKPESFSKYRNKRTLYNGIMYDSKKEAAFAQNLDILLRGRVIRSWERQIPFPIEINGTKICKYIADFRVVESDGQTIIYDVKGMKTAIYKLKKKLVLAVHNIEIIEV